MTAKRVFFLLLLGIIVLAGCGVAGAVWGDSFLQRSSHQLTSLKSESLALQEQQRSLIKAKKDVEKYTPLEKVAKSIVPQEKDQARTVREIIKLAQDSHVGIANITFPSSTLGDTPQKTAAAAAPGAATKKPTGTTQVEAVEGISGLGQMPITVQSDSVAVPYASLLAFLSKLEQNRRTAQVTNLSVQPSSTDRNKVTFNIILNVYIKQ
jgi:hypothetical protein